MTTSPQNSIRLLLVEDDEDNRILLAEVLGLRGYDVRVAESAERGVELVSEDMPEVILCDIGLPGASGHDFIAKVRAMKGGTGVPAFALTGYAGPEDLSRGEESGFDGRFVKPFDIAELDRILRETLGRAGA